MCRVSKIVATTLNGLLASLKMPTSALYLNPQKNSISKPLRRAAPQKSYISPQ
jgi:hypothetical protein